ncbi:hypothetical protein [Streptomyces sp. NPDC058964]|uniref:hypothetical protein n=1 Tax=Streptomyces sp. NPDC058964 TaxID=3346681 RepID=UPI0036B0BA46
MAICFELVVNFGDDAEAAQTAARIDPRPWVLRAGAHRIPLREEDHGMSFERYDSLFAVRDFDSNLERQEATARRIFDNLAALDRYELLLVRDLQELLASSGPSPQ